MPRKKIINPTTLIYMVYDAEEKRWFVTSRYMYMYLKKRWGKTISSKWRFAIQEVRNEENSTPTPL